MTKGCNVLVVCCCRREMENFWLSSVVRKRNFLAFSLIDFTNCNILILNARTVEEIKKATVRCNKIRNGPFGGFCHV